MTMHRMRDFCRATLVATLLQAGAAVAAVPGDDGATPLAVIDLTTPAGATAVAGQWRYSDVEIVPAVFRAPDAQGQPTGAEIPTYDYRPHAGGRDFDDSAWSPIDAGTLGARRGRGRLSFNWYRIRIAIPERVGTVETRGLTAVFHARLDDYAEVWVNGEITRPYGGRGPVVAGWNAANRLVVGRNVQPGDAIQLAVFGMNGPISDTPTNYIYVREARIEFHPHEDVPVALEPQEVNVVVRRFDPRIDAIVPPNAKLFKLADGFIFTEGPVWSRNGGYLLFSDPNHNTIYKYTEAGGLSVFRDRSGYDAADIAEYRQPGSNGLTFDRRGQLLINEHGRHRVSRLEADGRVTVLADRYRGRRLNSPNDLVVKSDGSVYFTDPPFGLPMVYDDPRKELPFSGVFRLKAGRLTLLDRDLKGPNGLTFSPDEKFLYVDNWDPAAKIVKRYPVNRDGTLGAGTVFADLTRLIPGDEALDGIKVDVQGNVYVSGAPGIWIYDSSGKLLGNIEAPRPIHNFAWGGADGRTLYLTARSSLYRMPLLVEGVRP
jgi:gluconolactonase